MKTYSKYIAFATAAMMFAACSHDEEITLEANDIVQISSAHIAVETPTRVNSLGAGNVFENADQILLVNESRNGVKDKGVYTATISDNTASWAITSGLVLWTATPGTNHFSAYYPATEEYVLPADQSTEEGFRSADRMTATATATKGESVNLNFTREMAKVTFEPTLISGITTIKSFTINSQDATTTIVTPYNNNGNYTAILTPGTYSAGEAVATIVAATATQEFTFTLKTNAELTLEAGKAYTFAINVGKEVIGLKVVSIKEWVDNTLDSGDAIEAYYSYDASTKTLFFYEFNGFTDTELETIYEEHFALGVENIVIGGNNLIYSYNLNYYTTNNINMTLLDVTQLGGLNGKNQIMYSSKITSLNAPKLESLSVGAICETSLTAFEIPATVTEIIGNPFVRIGGLHTNSPNLPSITVAPGNQNFSITDGLLYNIADGKVLVTSSDAYNEESSTVDIPAGTTAIGTHAFYYCENLKSVKIPNSVTSIGKDAFAGCSGLTSIEIPNSVTSIGKDAFAGCYDLNNVIYSGTMEEAQKLLANTGFLGTVECTDGTYTI